MRLFIALNIPDEIKEKISVAQDDLKEISSSVKWAGKDKFHLTLKFLGETSGDSLDNVVNGLKESVAGFGEFTLSFCGLGVFPGIHRPRIVWAGVKDGEDKIKQLAARIEDEMYLLDFQKEKREFSAHLTLGRLRSPRSFKKGLGSQENRMPLIDYIKANEKIELGSFAVKNIDLMQSILHPAGPEYKCLKSIFV